MNTIEFKIFEDKVIIKAPNGQEVLKKVHQDKNGYFVKTSTYKYKHSKYYLKNYNNEENKDEFKRIN